MFPRRLLNSAPRDESGRPALVVGNGRPSFKEDKRPLASVGSESPDVRSSSKALAPLGRSEVIPLSKDETPFKSVLNPPRRDDTPLDDAVVIGKFDGSSVDNGTLPPAM